MSLCRSALRNINFKHLNRDTSRVPPRRAQLATLDQACHRSSRIKEEEETHQLFNKRVASLVYHLSPFPSAHAACRLPAPQSPRIKKWQLSILRAEDLWKLDERKSGTSLGFFFFCNFILIAITLKTRPILMHNSFDLISSVNKLVCRGRGKRYCGGIWLLFC